MRSSRRARRGYAMMLVLVFMVLFLSMLGVAYRHVGAALRIETVHAAQTSRDEGSIQAIARALTLLETGLPPGSPYTCGVTLSTSAGACAITVTFTQESPTNWSVHAAPTKSGESPPPMPSTFASSPT